jgi:hypothetical protein
VHYIPRKIWARSHDFLRPRPISTPMKRPRFDLTIALPEPAVIPIVDAGRKLA